MTSKSKEKKKEKQVETKREVKIIDDMEFERVPAHVSQMWDRVVTLWMDFKSKKTNPDIFFINVDDKGYGHNYYIDGRDYEWAEIYDLGLYAIPLEVCKNGISISSTDPTFIVEYKYERKYSPEYLNYTWKWIVVIRPRPEYK